jgi:hypothetical protein
MEGRHEPSRASFSRPPPDIASGRARGVFGCRQLGAINATTLTVPPRTRSGSRAQDWRQNGLERFGPHQQNVVPFAD